MHRAFAKDRRRRLLGNWEKEARDTPATRHVCQSLNRENRYPGILIFGSPPQSQSRGLPPLVSPMMWRRECYGLSIFLLLRSPFVVEFPDNRFSLFSICYLRRLSGLVGEAPELEESTVPARKCRNLSLRWVGLAVVTTLLVAGNASVNIGRMSLEVDDGVPDI